MNYSHLRILVFVDIGLSVVNLFIGVFLDEFLLPPDLLEVYYYEAPSEEVAVFLLLLYSLVLGLKIASWVAFLLMKTWGKWTYLATWGISLITLLVPQPILSSSLCELTYSLGTACGGMILYLVFFGDAFPVRCSHQDIYYPPADGYPPADDHHQGYHY